MANPKLLLADDSVTIRKVVELTFADERIDVSTVGDANSAMQKFVEIQPDIVLVDVGLDGTNGYQICEMIKADEATKHIPVMLLVGSFEPFDHDEANRVGADAFLTKPFNSIRDLVGRVKTLLEREKEESGTVLVETNLFEETAITEKHLEPTAETEDIDYLYKSSFSDTARIEQFATVDSFLGDAGMDDEMIEASYIAPPSPTAVANSADGKSDETKEFDWSPESIVDDLIREETQTSSEPDVFVEDLQEPEKGGNAESIDEETPSNVSVPDVHPQPGINESNQMNTDPSTIDTIEISHTPGFVTDPSGSRVEVKEDPNDVIELLGDDEDWMGERVALASDADDSADILSFSDTDPAIHRTPQYELGEQPPLLATNGSISEVSVEMIERIAQRVMEKLSDNVVREIARVEVPRIAEKLIREALEQESKV